MSTLTHDQAIAAADAKRAELYARAAAAAAELRALIVAAPSPAAAIRLGVAAISDRLGLPSYEALRDPVLGGLVEYAEALEAGTARQRPPHDPHAYARSLTDPHSAWMIRAATGGVGRPVE